MSSLTRFLLLHLSWSAVIWACQFHGDVRHDVSMDYTTDILENLSARSVNHVEARRGRTAIINVRVFDGSVLLPESTVLIDGDRISRPCAPCKVCPPAEVYDAKGKTLIPGLIDSHAHPSNTTHLKNFTSFGVTTAVNAFCASPELCDSLGNHVGLTSIVKGSFIATSPNSAHAKMVGALGAPLLIHNESQAASFVRQQASQGADFIKVIGSAPLPGLSQAEQNALVVTAHELNKSVILHTSSYEAFEEGLRAHVDQIHHSTLDRPVDDRLMEMFSEEKTILCPTLTMMRAIVEQLRPANSSYIAASETVRKLHQIGATILAGTDANMQPTAPAVVAYGSSLHDELENLVAVGLSPVEALNAATSVPASYFGLLDRGMIYEGMRADLVLVDGDPTVDIRATRKIANVWVGGIPYF